MRRGAALALLAGLVVAAAVTLLLALSPAAAETAPGTTVAGLPAGGLDEAELTALLSGAVAKNPASLTVTAGTRQTAVRSADLGVQVDVPATVRRALNDSGAGRDLPLLPAPRGEAVTPVLRTDDKAFQSTVDAIVRVADVKEAHGALSVSGDEVQAIPPADGQEADPGRVGRELELATSRLPWPATVTVPVDPRPAHTTMADLEPLVEAARTLTRRPLVLKANDLSATVSPARLASQLTVVPVGDGPGHGLALALKPGAREALAEQVADELSSSAQEPRVTAPRPGELLTAKGNAVFRPRPASSSVLAPGKAGQVVPADMVLDSLKAVLAAPETASSPVTLTAQQELPKTTTAEARRINSVLGSFTTFYACCQPRTKNIALIARTIDGTLIPAGESFSLNGLAGRRTRAKGYVEAPFILDGELSTDIGGGVSQFATTTLNAAFFAGLQLNRFQPHSFYISRYPAGREATVNFPGIDLRWTNNTSGPVLVRTATSGTSVTVAIYGVNDKRTVSAISGPRRPVSGRDFRITVSRVVSVPGATPRRNSWTTTYNRPPEDD